MRLKYHIKYSHNLIDFFNIMSIILQKGIQTPINVNGFTGRHENIKYNFQCSKPSQILSRKKDRFGAPLLGN